MSDTTRAGIPVFLDPESFCDQVLGWLEDFAPFFEGLALARELDEAAAVEALLATREVNRLRVSWELWEALLEGDGGDAEEVLVPHLGELFSWFRFVLWGVALPVAPRLRVVS